MSWKAPANDGRATILGYMVEKREATELTWAKVNRRPVIDRTIKASQLTEGSEYEFRVIAINKAGLGKPSDASSAALAVDPVCKHLFIKPSQGWLIMFVCFFNSTLSSPFRSSWASGLP